MCSCLQD
jgi:hypothetical protein